MQEPVGARHRRNHMRWLSLLLLMTVAVACGTNREVAGTSQSVGRAERVSVFTHCGFYEIEVDDIIWTPESIDRGASPEGTGFNTTEGVAEVVGEKLVFRADAGFEVVFVPAPPELPPVPGCD